MLTEDDVLQQLTDFSKGAMVLDRKQQDEAHRLAVAIEDLLWNKAKAMVAESQGRALIFAYASDGTPILSRQSTVDTHRSPPHASWYRPFGPAQLCRLDNVDSVLIACR